MVCFIFFFVLWHHHSMCSIFWYIGDLYTLGRLHGSHFCKFRPCFIDKVNCDWSLPEHLLFFIDVKICKMTCVISGIIYSSCVMFLLWLGCFLFDLHIYINCNKNFQKYLRFQYIFWWLFHTSFSVQKYIFFQLFAISRFKNFVCL